MPTITSAVSPTVVHETILECLSQAQSDSPKSQSHALQTLSTLTKVSSHHRRLLADTPDALPFVIALSKSSSPSPQSLALSILFNLSLNPNLKQPLATHDTIRHLNSLILAPTSPQTARLAASLICSLAMADKNKALFGIAGTVEAIIKALDSPSVVTSPACHHLLSSAAELLQFHGNCTLAVRSGLVQVLVRILEGPNDDLGGSCLATLAMLARYEEGMEAIRGVEGVLGLVVDGLMRGCMLSRESAADILIRLFEGSDEMVREAIERAEFSSLIADLSIRGSPKAREKAGILMKMVMDANLDESFEVDNLILRYKFEEGT